MVVLIGVVFYAIYSFKKEKQAFRTVDMSLFTPDKDCTTVMPVPLHAATCDHNWDVVSDQLLEMPHEKKKVTILTCRGCGLIDKTVQTTSPPPLPSLPPPAAPM